MKEFDTAIIGAGLAGLQCAKRLAASGFSVLLVDRKAELSKGVHTTGIFVRKSLEDFTFPAGTLGKPIRNVTLYSPGLRSLELSSGKDEFRIGRMGRLYEAELRACVQNGVEFAADTQYLGSETTDRGSVISLEFKGIRYRVAAKVLVGSDGAASRVAKDLQLDENREWIVGYEQVFRSRGGAGEARLHCFLNARLAPGYLAWIADDGDEMHIGVGGYAAKFSPKAALNEFRDNIAARFVDLQGAEPAETRGGRIPVGGVLRRIANERGLLVGDAAGAVSPLTAGGLDPCLRLSAIAADVIAERLRSGDPRVLLKYSGELFRTRFTSRLWMRRLISAFSSQTALEIGCMLLRSRAGAAFAGHVFFGRGSFPDVELGREHSGAGNAMGFLDR